MQIISIGRESNCDIILNDSFVSRRHAQLIVLDNGKIMLRDTGSSNGTFINGIRITEAYLIPGDIVICASTTVHWQQYVDSLNARAEHHSQPPSLIHTEFSIQPEPQYKAIADLIPSKKENVSNAINTGAFWGSLLVIIGFFLPWERLLRTNGANIASFIANSGGNDSGYSILFYLFPVSAAIFAISAISGKVSDFAMGVRFIPSILLTIVVIVIISKSSNNSRYDDEGGDISGFFQLMGIGFILTIIGSVMMCFFPRKAD